MEEDNRGKQLEEAIIENYKQEEDMMILVFAQWCINHGLEPEELYRVAYPHQDSNERLLRVRKLTVSREEAGDIPLDTVLGVLSMFGNEDLAMVVSEAAASLQSERK
ncbi:hypothetical protein MF628_004612 [Paenibacillus polymyxa]|uniref:hypothetical protein n=1 Tax=Paenibacillus polymyxa TaxID=1406 RepID=UPI002024555A|nr:hypothetical protein [Paenibacillus polymyxa]URJ44850.1 hypothetical protein MF628_004612 [Paenibacillus polymyxa]